MKQDYPGRVGVVGTGNLASFMVAGTTRAGREVAFTVSPRGRDLSARLARDYGVEVATGNQEAVTGADLVLVSVLPGQAEAALADLAFGPEQVVLSVMAGGSLEKVSRLVAPAQAACALMPGHANAWA